MTIWNLQKKNWTKSTQYRCKTREAEQGAAGDIFAHRREFDLKSGKKSFLYLYLISTVTYSAFALIGPFLGAYYRLHDLTGTQIGILSCITCLFSFLVQPLWAARADRTGRAKTYVCIIALGAGISVLSYCFMHRFGGFVIATTLYALFYTSVSPMIDTISMRECRNRGHQFSLVRLGGTISYAVIALIIGQFIQKQPVLSFVLGSAAYFVLFILLGRLPESENHQPQPEKRKRRFIGRISEIFTDRSIYFVLILAFIFQLGFGFLFSFLSVYVTDLGYGQSLIGILQCISAATEIPILLIIHRMERKFGSLPLIAFAACLMGVRLLLCAQGSVPMLIFAMLLQGPSYMVLYYCSSMFIQSHVFKGKASEGQSVLYLVQSGAASIISNLFGGMIVDALGFTRTFTVVGTAMLISSGAVAAVMMVTERKKTG